MPMFPSFRRPCPYQANLAAVMEGDWCRMCGQQVHDITGWNDTERAALLARCATEEVCVSYRVPAALAAAALVASPALAASTSAHHPQPVPVTVMTLAGLPALPPAEPVTPVTQPAAPTAAPDPARPPARPRSLR